MKNKLSEARALVDGKMKVDADDERRLTEAETAIIGLNARLSNLDLAASIKKLGTADIIVKSVATGKNIDISTGNFDINETVEITIPGIMNLIITAMGVDVEEIKKQLAEATAGYNAILNKYKVLNIKELRAKKEEYAELLKRFEFVNEEYNRLTTGVELSKLELEYNEVKGKEEQFTGLNEKIEELCKSEPITSFIAKQEQKIEIIRDKYGKDDTVNAMKSCLSKVEVEIGKLDSIEDDAANIPEKYLKLTDLDEYKSYLNSNIDNAN